MRLSTDEDRDEARAIATIAAAAEAGITVFDTARAYGANERLLARALRDRGAAGRARIATKGGMSRPDGAWAPDARARSIRADCEASLAELDGLSIDLYLLHAPDPRTPWRTSIRALARLVDEGLVTRVGVCNVNRAQLDEALELAPIAAAQVALSPFDERALRGGVVDRCAELDIPLIAHSPLGGPRRVRRLVRHEALTAIAQGHGATAAEVALAWVLALGPNVIAIPGARHPETARSAARAAALALEPHEIERIGPNRLRPSRSAGAGEVVVVMGVPGAGKSRIAAGYVDRGYARLNRDERGGSLRDLAEALEELLASGCREVVLDNTYLTRATRSFVLETGEQHRTPVRCIWVDTPLAQAQVNLVERLLDRFGTLPTPDELREASRSGPGLLSPTQQMRAFRELEPPSDDEGFEAVEHVSFARVSTEAPARGGVFVAAAALDSSGWKDVLTVADPAAPHLVFDWRPGGGDSELASAASAVARAVSGPVEGELCTHPGGPPICWCRPPLPGLPLAFARRHQVDPARSLVVGTRPAHRTLATTLGAHYVDV